MSREYDSREHDARDPVCGMAVDPITSTIGHEHAGTTYYFCCDGCRTKFKTDPTPFLTGDVAPLASSSTVDPVCGMAVDPTTSTISHEHAGTTYYFCCDGCRTKFQADPERYLTRASEDTPTPPTGHLVYLPNGPGGARTRARSLSAMWDGAGGRVGGR